MSYIPPLTKPVLFQHLELCPICSMSSMFELLGTLYEILTIDKTNVVLKVILLSIFIWHQ